VNNIVQVTYTVLPGMVQKYMNLCSRLVMLIVANRKYRLILNIRPFAEVISSLMLVLYSATKTFMTMFTSALAEEVYQNNVMVEYINMYFVVYLSVAVCCNGL